MKTGTGATPLAVGSPGDQYANFTLPFAMLNQGAARHAAPEEDVVEVDTVVGWLGSYAI